MRAALWSRRSAKVVRAAAAALVLGTVIAGAFLLRRWATSAVPAEALVAAPEASPAIEGAPPAENAARQPNAVRESPRREEIATEREVAGPGAAVVTANPVPGDVPGARPPAEVLAEARVWAAADDWDRVIGMLSEGGLAWTGPQTFAWDSLLAQAALRRGRQLPAGHARRGRLLATARDRATLALASVAPFAAGTDRVRLLRAEACIAGELECENATVIEDLLLAARSPHVGVSDRAGKLLATAKP